MATHTATLTDGILSLDTGRLCRRFKWNDGHLATLSLRDTTRAIGLEFAADAPDVTLPDLPPGGPGLFTTREAAATAQRPAHLVAEVVSQHGSLELRREFRLYPGCPAIACDFYVRGTLAPPAAAADGSGQGAVYGNIENGAIAATAGKAAVLERLALPGRHWRVQAIRFMDRTDYNNNLVAGEALLPYYRETKLSGNLLLASDLVQPRGVFLIKEAPCSDVQLAWPGYDFTAGIGCVAGVGLGIPHGELSASEWIRGYSFVTGLFDGTELDALCTLRDYQKRRRQHLPGRDDMIMMNTWGDRSQDSRVAETFAMAELEAGNQLGISHFQLDDGWQSGRSSNSATKGGSLVHIWDNPVYWTPHPERFPRGLKPVVDRGRELGIEVCVWFNPSADDSYAHWREDADTLIRLHRECGVRTFKIDGVEIPDRRADTHLRALFDRVTVALNGDAVFNLDVTAGRRYGYHYFAEYGNLFVENRYTDWGNYYPHWTLRNLWQLSRYVPAEVLQVEFLNRWRNPGKYPVDDPLAPGQVPFDYSFAIAMMAQPLAWFEGTGLPEEAYAIAPLIARYRRHRETMHAGTILPVGEEPCGRGWTGFQSLAGESGWLLVFRERNDRGETRLQTWLPAGARIKSERLWGAPGTRLGSRVDADGRLSVSLPAPFTFAWFRYRLLDGLGAQVPD